MYSLPIWHGLCNCTIPCKLLITSHDATLPLYLYMLTTVNNNKYPKICTLDTIHVKKQHNKELRHIIEMLSMVIKDLLLHKCPLLLRIIAWNHSWVQALLGKRISDYTTKPPNEYQLPVAMRITSTSKNATKTKYGFFMIGTDRNPLYCEYWRWNVPSVDGTIDHKSLSASRLSKTERLGAQSPWVILYSTTC